MPILDVEVVADYEPDHGAALKIADRAAVVLGASEGQVWVKLRHVPRELYAENGRGDPCPDQPVFVKVTKGVVQDAAELRAEAHELTIAVAEALGRPVENVHIIYEPSATGRIAFGGKLAE